MYQFIPFLSVYQYLRIKFTNLMIPNTNVNAPKCLNEKLCISENYVNEHICISIF